MKSKEKRKVEEEREDAPRTISRRIYSTKDVGMSRRSMRGDAKVSSSRLPSEILSGHPEEGELSEAIDKALLGVEGLRREAHAYDEEIARLGEETRRLIAEMQRGLNLKAA